MNKKILTFFVIIFLSLWIAIVWVFADECSQSCNIEDAPAPALTEYFANINQITNNIISWLTQVEQTNSEKRQTQNVILWGMNKVLSVWKYYTSFDYTLSLPMTQEIPAQMKRDMKMFDSYSEKLNQILLNATKRGSAAWILTNVCNGVSNCDFQDDTSANIIVKVINNNEQIRDYMRSSILWKSYLADQSTFILTSSDMSSQISEYYNPDTLNACSQCDWGFKKQSLEQILTISNFTAGAKKWIQEWKDAWKLARGWSSDANYREQEAVILAWYLEEQWISADQAWVVMWNLNRYNGGWLTSSNPLSNTAGNALAQVENTADSFSEILNQKLSSWQDSIPFIELTRVDTQAQNSIDIDSSIASMYEKQLPFSYAQDVWTQQLQARIIKMHFSLTQSINILSKLVPQSEKLCNKQGVWMWNCSFR